MAQKFAHVIFPVENGASRQEKEGHPTRLVNWAEQVKHQIKLHSLIMLDELSWQKSHDANWQDWKQPPKLVQNAALEVIGVLLLPPLPDLSCDPSQVDKFLIQMVQDPLVNQSSHAHCKARVKNLPYREVMLDKVVATVP